MSEEIKNFVDNYINQDNRATRWPYAYVVQERVDHPAYAGCGDYTKYGCYEYECFDYDSKDELKKHLVEMGIKKFDIFSYEKTEYWEDKQWFFTENAAKKHLDANGHNYKETRLYVKYFHRHSEAEMILRSLFTIAGEDYDKHAR